VSLDKIEHFVVLMLENRSFDHLFGLRPGVAGIAGGNYANQDPQGGSVAAAGGAPFAIPTKHGLGPYHNLVDVNLQLFGTKQPAAGAQADTSGFVASYREALQHDTGGVFTATDLSVVMHSFAPADLPAINALADAFVLCDHWFCEVPGPTHPNRLYMHAGTSQGFVHNVFQRPFDCLSVYELLQRNGHTWAVYDFDLNEVKQFTRIAGQTASFRKYGSQFAQDVETNQLPNYSFILPRFSSTHHAQSTDQHAPHDVRWGEQLIADVYETLRGSQAVWDSCALFVTYDEHGGFYDHVAPPPAVNPDGLNSPQPHDNYRNTSPPPFAFDRLGLRVPALIASPWVGKGVVAQQPLQHTSILRSVLERFQIGEPLTDRVAAAPSLGALFDQASARQDTPAQLPRPSVSALPPADHHANPGNSWPEPTLQERIAGAIRMTRASHPEDDVAPPAVPNTEVEISSLAQRRYGRHEKWLRT
jgi:phospholipase C